MKRDYITIWPPFPQQPGQITRPLAGTAPPTAFGGRSLAHRGNTKGEKPVATNRGIYIIIDEVTQDIVGIPMLFRHEAAAVRMFSDLARMPNSDVARHIQDIRLVRVGLLEDDTLQITPDLHTVLEGGTWAAANQIQDPANS